MSKAKLDCITSLAEVLRHKLSEAALRGYVAALVGLSDQEAQTGASVAMQRCKFFPAPAELIEFAKTRGVGYESQAILAWEELDRALYSGQTRALPQLTKAIARQLGGFDTLMNTPLSELATWKRKAFIEAHSAMVKEDPNRLLSLASPDSEIVKALTGDMKLLPKREDLQSIEADNREKFQKLSDATPAAASG